MGAELIHAEILGFPNIYQQSKHIVIFDTLIKESGPEEVEAVLGQFAWSFIY